MTNHCAQSCEMCGGMGKTVDSRPHDKSASIKRRRECHSCGYRWTTYELKITAGADNVEKLLRRALDDLNTIATAINSERVARKMHPNEKDDERMFK